MCRCTCNCGCNDSAAIIDSSSGELVCDECSIYLVDDDGEVICSKVTNGFSICHICHEIIKWGCIQTGNPGSGSPNYIEGSCKCGDSWLEECRGNWGYYSYFGKQGEQCQ